MSLIWRWRRKGWIALAVAGVLWTSEVGAWDGAAALTEIVVAVDKSRQRLFVSEGEEKREYVCTTGQHPGDKRARGDLKTPEGVYFIVGKRTSGLDFQDYGGVAYILDYPNPVDRLRGKTGSGIWLHSRGRPITPRESRGCVVVNLEDIALMGPKLRPGTPVVIAENLRARPGREEREALRHVERQTLHWRAAQGRGGEKPVQEAGGKVGPEEQRMKRQTPLNAEAGPVRVLAGPGYWVSWFGERLTFPDGTTREGTRRLYWRRGADGGCRLVAVRWLASEAGESPKE